MCSSEVHDAVLGFMYLKVWDLPKLLQFIVFLHFCASQGKFNRIPKLYLSYKAVVKREYL